MIAIPKLSFERISNRGLISDSAVKNVRDGNRHTRTIEAVKEGGPLLLGASSC